MALPTFINDRKNAKGQREGAIFLGTLNASHEVTAWTLISRTGNLTVTPNGTKTKYTDDTGATYREHEVVNDYNIEATFLEGGEDIRQLFQASGNTFKDQTYAVCFLDAKYNDSSGTEKQGYWVFYEVEFYRTDGPWNIGGAEKGYKLMGTAYANTTCESVTITLPSGETCFTPTATGAAIGAGEFYITADGATS
jgi:hypothetical protein